MNTILIGVTLFLRLCVARHPLDRRVSSSPHDESSGFPSELLPPLDMTENPTQHLRVPLDPEKHPDVKFSIEFSPIDAGPLKGGQLASSILSRILVIWEDTANARIVRRIDARASPFVNILHTLRPALLSGAPPLTPAKVGIVYCWIIDQVLKENTWPGHITAGIYDGDAEGRLGMPLGVLYIENKPEASALGTLTNKKGVGAEFAGNNTSNIGSKVNDTTHQLSTPQDIAFRERAWLKVFLSMIDYVIKKPPSARVADFLPPLDKSVTAHFRCREDPNIEGIMFISRLVGALQWRSVAQSLLDLSVRAATVDMWEGKEREGVMSHGVEVVKLYFVRHGA